MEDEETFEERIRKTIQKKGKKHMG